MFNGKSFPKGALVILINLRKDQGIFREVTFQRKGTIFRGNSRVTWQSLRAKDDSVQGYHRQIHEPLDGFRDLDYH